MCEICRRGFIRGAATLGATAAFSPALMAQTPRTDSSATKLPARGEFTITNADVMTMERDFGDFTGGSVHVKDGEIVAVGHGVSGGETIDGSGMIVMPGLVETHWHMWNTLFRSFAGDKPEDGYFPTSPASASR
jgi:5-methylthioadenosine/S-adenosylhomocysteine deaminase